MCNPASCPPRPSGGGQGVRRAGRGEMGLLQLQGTTQTNGQWRWLVACRTVLGRAGSHAHCSMSFAHGWFFCTFGQNAREVTTRTVSTATNDLARTLRPNSDPRLRRQMYATTRRVSPPPPAVYEVSVHKVLTEHDRKGLHLPWVGHQTTPPVTFYCRRMNKYTK